MGFFSGSSKHKPYKHGNYGNNHYQRRGLLDQLFRILGSGGHSDKHYNRPPNPYANYPNQSIHNQSVMTCGKCKIRIPAGSKFCLVCGEKVIAPLVCVNCAESLPPHAKFCLKCGTKTN